MKRYLTFYILFLSLFALNAQEVKLTIETTAGGLKDAMTEEQRETVTDLTLTGSMNDADFYFIRDNIVQLISLNMEKVKVDTIPEKAFYKSGIQKFVIPEDRVYVKCYAFKTSYEMRGTVFIIGHFPKIESHVFDNNYLEISDDNPYCKMDIYSGGVYSLDGKIFYYFGTSGYLDIEEGTEIIESFAFDSKYIESVSFPSTLKLIKTNAFYEIKPLYYNGVTQDLRFISYASIPPVLEKNAFNGDQFSKFDLFVPSGKTEDYKQADLQWSKFNSIVDGDPNLSSVEKHSLQTLFVSEGSSGLIIHSQKQLMQIQVNALSGENYYQSNVQGTEASIPAINGKNIYVLKVIFEDHTVEYLKIRL